jgi:hypothetical protein
LPNIFLDFTPSPGVDDEGLSLMKTEKFEMPCGLVELNVIQHDKGMPWSKVLYLTKNVQKGRVLFMKKLHGRKTRVIVAVPTERAYKTYRPATGMDVRTNHYAYLFNCLSVYLWRFLHVSGWNEFRGNFKKELPFDQRGRSGKALEG